MFRIKAKFVYTVISCTHVPMGEAYDLVNRLCSIQEHRGKEYMFPSPPNPSSSMGIISRSHSEPNR
uniref:Uncharacterized protein n=1 Tax=Megaselia scalaris TaxID=36166 RepID=T1GMD4_MEGSC